MNTLSEVELVAAMPFGEHMGEEPLPEVPHGLTLRAVLEDAVVEALERPPCLVSFSGGRDSSAVLALATDVARRRGLPLPVPTTYRFPGVSEADEASWQELVVGHLGLPDWHRTDVTDEFELIGPEAAAALRRHGLLLPFNSYVHAPLLREARGGSLMTGFDGDGLFDGWRWQRAASVWGLRVRPEPIDLLRVAMAAAPARMRVAWAQRRGPLPPMPWLWPHAEKAVRRAWAVEQAGQPVTWRRQVARYARRRPVVIPCLSLGLLAEEADARLVHPLREQRFLATLARVGGRFGGGTRTDWMRTLFGDLLPEQVLTRAGKADVAAAHWGERTSRFADDWDGSGLDESLVRVDALREAWKAREWLSATLLQAAWLASDRAQQHGASAAADLAGRS